jgi:hypothetical protein
MDHNDITEILLKVALNTIILASNPNQDMYVLQVVKSEKGAYLNSFINIKEGKCGNHQNLQRAYVYLSLHCIKISWVLVKKKLIIIVQNVEKYYFLLSHATIWLKYL